MSEGKASRNVFDILVEQGGITESQRATLAAFSRRWCISPLHAVLETKTLSEAALADFLAEGLQMDRVFSLASCKPVPEAMTSLGYRRAKAWECFPLGWRDSASEVFELAFSDPTSALAQAEEFSREVGCKVAVVVAERSDILAAIDELFPLQTQIPSLVGPAAQSVKISRKRPKSD